MKKAEALAAIRRLEGVTHSFGLPNADALQKVDSIVSQLRSPELSGGFQHKLHSFKHWASIGISTRKFARSPGGAEGVRSFALQDCEAMKIILEQLPLPD